MIRGKSGVGRSFTFGVGSLEEHEEHGEERGEITRGNTQEQVQITHPLDNQTHKITRYMNNKGKDTR